MRRIRTGVVVVASIALAWGAVTYAALEGAEVIVIESGRAPNVHRTRAWIATDAQGELWLEAASADSPWLRDLSADSEITIERGDQRSRYVATPVRGEAARARIRGLLRARYGWRDAWVGWWLGQADSVAVRVTPP